MRLLLRFLPNPTAGHAYIHQNQIVDLEKKLKELEEIKAKAAKKPANGQVSAASGFFGESSAAVTSSSSPVAASGSSSPSTLSTVSPTPSRGSVDGSGMSTSGASSSALSAAKSTANKFFTPQPAIPVPATAPEPATVMDPAQLVQIKLIEAQDLTALAFDAYTEGKYVESLDKHHRAGNLRVAVMGESHSVATENWHAMGQIYMQLGKEDEAISYLEKSYEIRRKKKKLSQELRWGTGMLLAMVYRGSLRFQDAQDLYKKCHTFFLEQYGEQDQRTVEAHDQKKWCQKLQGEKWWLVEVMNFIGEEHSKFNGRKGRLFPSLQNVILMMTGELVHPTGKHNYRYMVSPDSHDLPPELGGGDDKKASVNMTDELATMRMLKRKHPTESIQFYIDKFTEIHPDIPMNKNKAKKLLKDLEKVGSAAEKQHAEQIKQMSEELRKNILTQLRGEMHQQHLECAICLEPYSSSMEAYILKSCGHSFCQKW
jgi:tetratricopeptide (TPR) repeat protein